MVSVQTALIENPENTDHIAESYTGIYSMHKYWSKKPFNIIRKFILKYTAKDQIVVDPFCGSGISITESIFTKRKAIGIDINPVAIFITKQMLNRISIKELDDNFKRLESECKDKINSFYLIERGDNQFVGTHFVWKNDELVEVWYTKEKGRNNKIVEKPTEKDIKNALSFSYKKIPYFYPKGHFFYNPRINTKRENHIYDLFTPRNLMALSFILDRIEKIQDKNVRSILKFCFTSCLGQASRMVFIVKRRGKFSGKSRQIERKEVGSWVIGYWIPKENFEINAWNCFENRYKRVLKAKKEQEELSYCVKEANEFEGLITSKKNLLLINDSAVKVLKNIPDNSVDYVITDPPHGNRLPYLELSMMWNEWLKRKVNYEAEIVISDSKERRKDIKNYYSLLGEVFKNIERILKPRHRFSLMFNSLDDETWIHLIKYMNELCLELEEVETLNYSANSVVQDNRAGGLKTDFIFTFRKNPNKIIKEIDLYESDSHKDIMIKMIEDYITKSKNGLEIYEILNNLVIDLLKHNKFFKLSEVLTIIRTEFKKKGNKWVKEN